VWGRLPGVTDETVYVMAHRDGGLTAQLWYAGGPSRRALQEIAMRAFRAFRVTTYAAPEHGAPPGDLTPLCVTTTDFNMYCHSDGETPEMVRWTGLEATWHDAV